MKRPRALNYTNHVVSWTIQGIQYGYPPCCIGEFVIHAVKNTCKSRGKRLFYGTGFVPCIRCNERQPHDIIDEINHRRDKSIDKFTGTVKR